MTNAMGHDAAAGQELGGPVAMSKLAITSMLISLLSCVPGLGLIAAVLGVVALYRIGASKGQLGGRTPAAVGMSIGLIATTVYLAFGLGARQMYVEYAEHYATPAAAYFAKVEAGSPDALAIFEPATAPTQADLSAFGASLTAALGKPLGPVSTLADMRRLRTVGGSMPAPSVDRQYAGGPIRFERGVAIVMLRYVGAEKRGNRFPAGGDTGRIDEIILTTQDGQVLRLPPAPPSTEKAP